MVQDVVRWSCGFRVRGRGGHAGKRTLLPLRRLSSDPCSDLIHVLAGVHLREGSIFSLSMGVGDCLVSKGFARLAASEGARAYRFFEERGYEHDHDLDGRLLILGRFSHDSQRVLTTVCELALVRIELLSNAGLLILAELNQCGRKLHVAILANTQQVCIPRSSHDSQFSLWHETILRRQRGRLSSVEIKRHHYRNGGAGRVK